MDSLVAVRSLLRDSLQLGDRAESLTRDSRLLGGIPEFDSMAVVSVIGLMEDRFGISLDDDELSADLFATVGTLADFVSAKTGS
jgi:acyl carrier protein